MSVVTQKYLNHRHPTFHPITNPTLYSPPDPAYPPRPVDVPGTPARDFRLRLRCYSVARDNAMTKLLYLALRNIKKKWTMPIRDWGRALNQFAILFENRVPLN